MLQPLIVRPLADGRYELIAGERRWRAAREAGLDTVPAVVRDEDEAQRLQTALIENMAREDLNPVDEARACAALVEELGLSKEELGAPRSAAAAPAISNLIRLLDLPDEVLELLSERRAQRGPRPRDPAVAKGNDVRRRLARDAVAGGWSVRETERRAQGGGDAAARKVVPHPDQEAALRARRGRARAGARAPASGCARPRKGDPRGAQLRRASTSCSSSPGASATEPGPALRAASRSIRQPSSPRCSGSDREGAPTWPCQNSIASGRSR